MFSWIFSLYSTMSIYLSIYVNNCSTQTMPTLLAKIEREDEREREREGERERKKKEIERGNERKGHCNRKLYLQKSRK